MFYRQILYFGGRKEAMLKEKIYTLPMGELPRGDICLLFLCGSVKVQVW